MRLVKYNRVMASSKDKQKRVGRQVGMLGLDGADEEQAAHADAYVPLAARMRPRSLDEFLGQEQVIGPGRTLRKAVEAGKLSSLILWGPPGSGKTTLARLLSTSTGGRFVQVSAVAAGVNDLRRVIEQAQDLRLQTGQRTILFIDEIHRFNKAQQDVILPYVEDGTITMIGATTENPSFEVNSALLSRSRVYTLRALSDEEIRAMLVKALNDVKRGLGGQQVVIEPEALTALVMLANGDARSALNALELAADATAPDDAGQKLLTVPAIEDAMQRRALLYDKGGDQHYDIISALHKTMRGSDPDGALYWLGRMLEAGEDPLYIIRRVVRFASEDIGMADPNALVVCMAAQQAVHFIGLPEGELALAQAVVYCSVAPKSNALYMGYKAVKEDVHRTRTDPVPLHLRNAPTPLMKNLGYGAGYKYAHDYEGGYIYQAGLPTALKGRRYYQPTDRGIEARIQKRLAELRTAVEGQDKEQNSAET